MQRHSDSASNVVLLQRRGPKLSQLLPFSIRSKDDSNKLCIMPQRRSGPPVVKQKAGLALISRSKSSHESEGGQVEQDCVPATFHPSSAAGVLPTCSADFRSCSK